MTVFNSFGARIVLLAAALTAMSGCCTTVHCDWEYAQSLAADGAAAAGPCSRGCAPASWRALEPHPALGR